MRTLITGGAGFIGSNLGDALLEQGHQVVVVDDLSGGKEANLRAALAAGAILHRADIRDGNRMRELLAEVRPEVVFHLAAQVDVRISLADPAADARANVEGTVSLLEAARLAGARRFVFSSTGGAMYGDTDVVPTPESVAPLPMSAYGQSKFCAERYLAFYERAHGLSTVALRFGNVYGPRQDPHGEAGVVAIFCGLLRAGKAPIVYGTGEQTRDYIYVGDVVEGLLAAAASDVTGEINLGTEEETSVLTIVEQLGALEPDVDFRPELRPARAGELDRSCLHAGRAREELGWQATVAFADGVRRTYAATAG